MAIFETKKLGEELKYRKKKKLGSYPYLSVLLSITLALFVIGLFTLMIFQANKLISLVRENIEVQVFLNKNVSENDIIRLRNVLSNSSYVLKSGDQPAIRFISKKDAAESFIRETGEDFREFLDDNPLRDAYVIHLQPSYQHADSLSMIKKQLEVVPGIYQVDYIESLIDSINRNIAKLSAILLGIALIILLIVVVLINNTIKLAMYSQRFLIRSMQLVGAKQAFILWPFLKRSVWHGILAGIFASVSLILLLKYAGKKIQGMDQLINVNNLLFIFVCITLLGIIIAFLSTFRAIKKYLNMSLDELY